MVVDIFAQPLHHKKASYGPELRVAWQINAFCKG